MKPWGSNRAAGKKSTIVVGDYGHIKKLKGNSSTCIHQRLFVESKLFFR